MEEQNTETHRIIPTFLRKPEQSSAMSTHNSLHVFRRSRRRWREDVKMQHTKEMSQVEELNDDEDCVEKEEEEEEKEKEEEDEREEIEKKIHTLQRIVPNGESFGVDKLFDETAGYIVALQYQVKALRALTGFFEKLEKEKTKFGG